MSRGLYHYKSIKGGPKLQVRVGNSWQYVMGHDILGVEGIVLAPMGRERAITAKAIGHFERNFPDMKFRSDNITREGDDDGNRNDA